MDARFIITLIMGVLLMAWGIFCAVRFFQSAAEMIIKSGLTGHVKCEKCGTEYDVSAEEFTKSYMVKSKSMTRDSGQRSRVCKPQDLFILREKIFLSVLRQETIRAGTQYQ